MWQASVRYTNEVEGGINGHPVKLLWWDDKYTVPGALASWEAAKAAKVHTFKIMSSSSAVALHDALAEYKMGTISQAAHPVALVKPTTLFTFYALGSDAAGCFLDWVLDDWKDRGKTGTPKVAIFTYDNPMGRSAWIPATRRYAESIGLSPVAEIYVPQPVVDPTPQLEALKASGAQYAFGFITADGTGPVFKTGSKLGIFRTPANPEGITLGLGAPAMPNIAVKSVGPEALEGLIVVGQWRAYTMTQFPGIKKMREILEWGGVAKPWDDMTVMGRIEFVLTKEALRLATEKVPAEKLTHVDVLEQGWYRIKDFDTGGLISEKVTYGPEKNWGVETVEVFRWEKGQLVFATDKKYPIHWLLPEKK
jgi:hypothetical protein